MKPPALNLLGASCKRCVADSLPVSKRMNWLSEEFIFSVQQLLAPLDKERLQWRTSHCQWHPSWLMLFHLGMELLLLYCCSHPVLQRWVLWLKVTKKWLSSVFPNCRGCALGLVNASRLTICLFTFSKSLCSHQMVLWADAGTAQYSVVIPPVFRV